jgi:predicted house-cleaning noncanonical NTP pyrophosphatase (MazG superfamily)
VTVGFYYSSDEPVLDWSTAQPLLPIYGPKGALLTVIPRAWTPQFVLISSDFVSENGQEPFSQLDPFDIAKLWSFCSQHEHLILRSSVIGETIWDRGTYESFRVHPLDEATFISSLNDSAKEVMASAKGHRISFVFQDYRKPVFSGEFGNLVRVSKTRDHWEVSSISDSTGAHSTSLNTQRDIAANPALPLAGHINPSNVRSFGSIAAWINNELLLGVSCRVNCEWVFDGEQVVVVQLDEEGPDDGGVNPLQVRVPPMMLPLKQNSRFLRLPDDSELKSWDKLVVIDQLSTAGALVKPTLFFLPLADIEKEDAGQTKRQLTEDFANQIGPDEIIIRTSVRAGSPKLTNLPKTEGLTPAEAADWCLVQLTKIVTSGQNSSEYAFVAHRFMASRASAWARCDPNNPNVEIHVNWGLADALQYYPYDKVDVHVPTKNVSYYPDYKSHFVMSKDDGSWSHVRVKNEVARSQCMTRTEVLDVASRSLAICQRLGEPCHIMWFVGCTLEDRQTFNLPWYWTKVHEQSANSERVPPKATRVRNHQDLESARITVGATRHSAIDLCPTDLNLMRDTAFLEQVANLCKEKRVPVILAGSPLAHAYYQLQKNGCSIISTGARHHTRVRNTALMGKLVRDKIPARIKASKEHGTTKVMPSSQVKKFLVSKLVEEALEYREANNAEHRIEELADAFEILRALLEADGVSVDTLIAVADKKREKAGGFKDGVVLIETSIGERKTDNQSTQVLAQKVSPNSVEIPFTFFGFMELGKPTTVFLEEELLWCTLTLQKDRILISIERDGQQLDLDFNLS